MTLHYQAQRMREQELEQAQFDAGFPPQLAINVSGSNHEISGIQDWNDLENIECAESYKNEFEIEADFSVTRSNIVDLYETQI